MNDKSAPATVLAIVLIAAGALAAVLLISKPLQSIDQRLENIEHGMSRLCPVQPTRPALPFRKPGQIGQIGEQGEPQK